MSDSPEAILKTLREVLAELLSVNPDDLKPEARFSEDLEADSLDLVEAVMAIEEHYDIEIPEASLESVTTVGGLIALIRQIQDQ